MAQKINRLKVTDLKRTKLGLYADGAGLYLRIAEAEAKDGSVNRSWIYRYTRDEYTTSTRKDGTTYRRQKEGVVGLGPHPQVGLEDARAAARELDRKRRSGEDRNPAKTRQAEKAARRVEKAEEQAAKKEASKPTMTFDKALDLCVENTKAKWTSDRHAKQVPDSLIKHAPSLGSMSITDINIEHVLAVLRPIWRTRSETASRIRGRIQRVLDTGYSALHPDDPLAAQELIDRNPARLTSHLKFLLGEHDRSVTPFEAMPLSRVACFVKALRDDGSRRSNFCF